MGNAFLHGNGGSSGGGLNFKVVGGLTQPANLKENSIWVITDVPITTWIFSPTQPEPPADGKNGPVWFLTGTSSNRAFNALKKNSIEVHPISAKQYVGGAWVSVDAKSYQNGELKPWAVHLYNNGDECLDVSGGFNAYPYVVSGSGSSARAPTLTKNETSMTIAETSTSSYAGAVFHETPFTVDDFSKLVVVYSGKTGGNSPTLDLTKTKATGFVRDASVSNLESEGTAEIDISQLSGEYYFAVTLAGSYKKSITIHEIKLM